VVTTGTTAPPQHHLKTRGGPTNNASVGLWDSDCEKGGEEEGEHGDQRAENMMKEEGCMYAANPQNLANFLRL